MDRHFLIIAITAPWSVKNEVAKICNILYNNEADLVHVRKPDWDIRQTAALLSKIPSELYPRLKLHDHFSLLTKFQLGGVHLNSRSGEAPANTASVSRSFHSVDQLSQAMQYDYVTLSPIFDSISKTAYRSAFSLHELKPLIFGRNIVALGGVTPDKFPILKETGFIGAAMLGYFWK